MKLFDIGEISKREITPEGYLKVSAKVAKIGLQEYAPIEFVNSNAPEDIKTKSGTIKLLRPENEVSDKEALATIESVPVTDGHPSEFVDASNVTQVQKGFSKPGVKYENGFVFADLIIQDSALIKRVQSGKDQVSLGYRSKIKWGAGVDDNYGAFDGTQTQIRVNHIAIVDSGRAGPEVRLDDETKGANEMAKEKADKTENTELVDGLKDEIAVLKDKLDAAEKAADKLRGELDAANTKIADELNDAAVDARVNARIELVDRARKLHADLDANGKSDSEIKKEAILKVNDSFDLKDRSDEYIDGVFESLAMSVKDSDAIVKDLKDSSADKPDARAKFIARSKDAYKVKGDN
jgi:hypothetical protein